MGEPRGQSRNATPEWRDPFPFAGPDQRDAHLVDLQRMAARDLPTLHDTDDLSETMGGHAITGASSTMHSLARRQEALEVIEQRATWLANYLTPERLDEAEAWRDQMERRKHQARETGQYRSQAQNAMSKLRLSIQHSYADGRAALAAWQSLVDDPGTGGLAAAAKLVSTDPTRLGHLKGGKIWFGLGRENHDRLRARDRLVDLVHNATQHQHYDALAQKAERRYKAMDDLPRPAGRLAETLAAMRDVRRINLHYMLNLEDKIVQSRALLASRSTEPVASLAASHALYQELRAADNPGERITATQLKKAMASTSLEVRHHPDLSASLATDYGLDADNLFTERPAAEPLPAEALPIDHKPAPTQHLKTVKPPAPAP
ncbi:MAG: hypothetical protein AAF213_01840 [Pseudomonadota bacterium]